MGNPFGFGSRSIETLRLQKALAREGLYTGALDGIFGRLTKLSVEAAQQRYALVVTGSPDNALLTFLGLVEAKPVRKPGLFDWLAIIIDLKKGKQMTSDQITGVVRAILAAVSGYFVAKGIGSADLWNWIVAGVTGIIPVVWTWYNNRPKVIQPLAKK